MHDVEFGEFTDSIDYVGHTCGIVELMIENDIYVNQHKSDLMVLIPDDLKKDAAELIEILAVRIMECAQDYGASVVRTAFDDFIEEYRQVIMEAQRVS